MTETAQEKAQRYATASAKRVETTYIVREWWTVTKPGEAAIPVFFCPPQTQAGIMQNFPGYRHCGVLPV